MGCTNKPELVKEILEIRSRLLEIGNLFVDETDVAIEIRRSSNALQQASLIYGIKQIQFWLN
jgi:hypothetical protein